VRHRHLPAAVWLGIALAMAGLAMVAQVWHGFALNPVGVAAGFGSALSTTGYFLIGEHGANTRDPFGLLAGGLVIRAIAVGFAAPPWLLPIARFGATATLDDVALPAWLVITLLAMISTAVPYLCGLASLRHLPSPTASVLGLLEPVTATVLAWWLIGQSLQPLQSLGGVAVLSGAILVQFSDELKIKPAGRRHHHRHRPRRAGPARPPPAGHPARLTGTAPHTVCRAGCCALDRCDYPFGMMTFLSSCLAGTGRNVLPSVSTL
jgi:drug/metabolite transporter (DMT)-like permease